VRIVGLGGHRIDFSFGGAMAASFFCEMMDDE
jgi:hypothetical protein